MPCGLVVPIDDAVEALRAAVAAAKATDQLAPVTVAPPSAWAGLSLRRALTREGGLVNVRFMVLARVAELLGAPRLAAAGRLPLTPTVRLHALTEAMLARPGPFRRALEHPAALSALAARLVELEQADAETRRALASAGGATAALVALSEEVGVRLAGHYGAEDLASAAAAAVDRGDSALADLGHVVVHLPTRLSIASGRLLDSLHQAGRLTIIAGHVGGEEADRLTMELVARFGLAADRPAAEPAAIDRLFIAPDPDVEVRVIAQELTARLRSGTPLHRMAVLYRNREPYARLLHEHLDGCGLPVAGPNVSTLAQSVSGRTLLGLLGLADADFSRQSVLAVLNGGPVRQGPGGTLAPVAAWERLSRDANIVSGLGRWQQRLEHLQRRLLDDAAAFEARGEDGDGRRLAARRAGDLRDWIAATASVLVAPVGADWDGFAEWAAGLLEQALDTAALDAKELEAHDQVMAALDRLSCLAAAGEGRLPSAERFLTALRLELDATVGSIGRFGQGVFVGPLDAAAGTSFDVVFVVGMAEGAFPPRRADDPLLPDRLRAEAAGGDLDTRRRHRQAERRSYLAALHAAPIRVLSAPRSDLRSQQPRLPSRWFVEAASAHAGRPIAAAELFSARPEWSWLEVVPSLTAALRRPPATVAELRLAELQRWVNAGGDAVIHPFLLEHPSIQRGIAATAARASGGLNEWEGLVGRHPLLAIDPGRPLSPTALQSWAECPRRYLLDRVLHVRETARPEEVLQLNALDQGSLVHAALEQFFRERADAGDLGRPWTDADRVRLLEIVEQLCAEVEAQGLTGKPVLWALQRRNLHEHLQVFLEHDAAHRAGSGLVPLDFEIGFGGPEDPLGPLTFSVSSRTLRFHGRIDRIDATPDRSVIEVIDYKTGRSDQVRAIDADCVDGGRRLQLPVYALAAARAFPEATITASYWFVTDTGSRHEHKPVPLTEQTRARFADVVGHIANGIEDGVFPGNPGEEDRESWRNCRYCPYDRVCPSQRDEIWERVVLSEAAGSYRSLRPPAQESA